MSVYTVYLYYMGIMLLYLIVGGGIGGDGERSGSHQPKNKYVRARISGLYFLFICEQIIMSGMVNER